MPPELRPRKETPTPSKPAPARRSRKTPLKLANYFTAPPPGTDVENNDSKTVEKKRGRSRAKKETDEIRHDGDSIQLDSAETPNISLELTGCHAKDKEDRTEPIIQTPSKIRVDKNLGEEDCGVEEDKGEVVASAQKDNNNSCAPMSRQQRRRELDLNKSLGSWPQQLEQRESRSQTLSKKKQMVENEVEVICLDDDDDDGNCDSVEKLHGKTRVQQQLCSNKPDEAPKPSLGFVLENADEGLDAAAVGMAVEKVVEQPKETDVEMAVVEHSNVGQEEAVDVVEMAVRRQHSNASLEEASVECSMDMEKVSMGHTSSVEVVEMPEGHASAGGKIPGEKQSERGTGHALLPGDGEDTETEVLVAQKQTEEGVVQESEMIEEEKLEVEDSQSNRPENAHMRVKELRSSEREHGNEEVNDRNSGAASEQMATCSDDVEQAQEDSTPGNENQGDYQAMVDGTGGDHLKENAVKQSESAMVQDVQVGRHLVVGDRKHPLEENVKECPIDLVDSEGHNHLEENPKEDSPMLEDPQAHEVLSSIVSEEHDTVHLHASLVTERINNLQGEEIYEKRPPSEGPHTGNLHDYPLSELTPEVQECKVLEGGTLTENDAGDSHDSSSAESEPEDGMFDVFLNHRGPDVKGSFVAHLHQALQEAGCRPFLDKPDLEKGQPGQEKIYEALRRASVHVAIFSKHYADCDYCLDELCAMLESKKLIIPVFYDVSPSVLRCEDPDGPYTTAFRKTHKGRPASEVKKWKDALHTAAELNGFKFDDYNGNEAELKTAIVSTVRDHLRASQQPPLAPYQVGLKETSKELIEALNQMEKDVGILSLVGMGGIGKTTLAKELYRSFENDDTFEKKSFLMDVRESAILDLQKQLARHLFKEDVKDTEGFNKCFNRVMDHKVLIVIDDVDHKRQFDQLIPDINKLCPGSRVIITSRDSNVVKNIMEKKENCKYWKHEMALLSTDSEEEEDDRELIKLVAKSLNTHLKQENARVGSKDRVDPSNSTSRTDGIDEVMYIDDSRDRDAAEAAAEAMHIRWAPKTGLPMIDSKGVADSSGQRTIKGVSEKSLDRSVWRGEKDLEDGLLVPSLDPRKLRKLAKKAAKDTAGSKWFDMPAPTVTPEIKKELQLLQLRGVMDPKRHYKASDMKGIPKYFQIGTVVEGGADFYSGRLTKKERKGTFADELLADTSLKAYRKRKYKEIQEEKQAGGKKFWKQKKNRQKPSWAKT